MAPKKTIEETYIKTDQHNHILDLPDTYVGSIESVKEERYVLNSSGIFVKKYIEFSKVLLKIFDEILVNAIDETVRNTKCNVIKVTFDIESGEISVMNNSGIPVEIHKKEKMYVPELIFGQLLTSSNYNKDEIRVVGGKNGYGCKLTNIYSKKFTVDTVCIGKHFKQEYSNNMFDKKEPIIKETTKSDYTKITFIPDYNRLGLKGLSKEMALIIEKRVYDCIPGTSKNVSIYLNGINLKIKDFMSYIKMYNIEPVAYQLVDDKIFNWEIAIGLTENFEQVSFVNGINTTKGGRHVQYVTDQIIKKLSEHIVSKKKIEGLKSSFIKERLFIFVKATIDKPTFDSQTKEELTSHINKFGIKFDIDDKFITKLSKSGIVEDIISLTKFKNQQILEKATPNTSRKSKIKVEKLEDAEYAGTKKSKDCSLFLVEGDSAKTMVMSGFSIIGRQYYGVYPLRGKCCSDDTKIPLWNGEIKLAKDIQIGDILIGDDGNKRNVITLFKDKGKMYEISQDRGESYKVNDEHILSLCIPENKSIYWSNESNSWRSIYWDKETKRVKVKAISIFIKIECNECGEMMDKKSLQIHYKRRHKDKEFEKSKTIIDMNDLKVIEAYKKLEDFLSTVDDSKTIDICIKDYLDIPNSLKRKLRGIRGECVNWEEKKVSLDPYVLGLWLGDGAQTGYSYACDGGNDYQIMDYLHEWGRKNDSNLKISGKSKYCYNFSSIDNFRNPGYSPLKKVLSLYNLVNNKHIPKEYLINSKEIRLRLLAGIIDSDGHVNCDGSVEISQSFVHKQLADDIIYLSRSLGFYTSVREKTTNYKYVSTGEYAKAYIIKISGDIINIPTLLPRKKTKSTLYNNRNSTGTIKINPIDDCNYVGIGIDGNNRFLINDFTVTHNCLNVREATQSQLLTNVEIQNIITIIGLQRGKKYANTESLRYGCIIILTDSDVDGYHITGLIINFIQHWWPELLEIKGFLRMMQTPIVKISSGKEIKEFYTVKNFNNFFDNCENKKKWNVKYYKGLGTSTSSEAKDLFKKLDKISVDFYSKSVKETDTCVNLAFNKSLADKRKEWLLKLKADDILDTLGEDTSIDYFINNILIHFSWYDVVRSIPNAIDGLKPGQRKIIYTMFKKNYNSEIKVAQFAGAVGETSNYHHGEASLQGSIIKLAQNFVGSNNMNLLSPNGQFGTRVQGGLDSASPRYIFTELSQYSKLLFNSIDLEIVDYIQEEGHSIEPNYYIPILPIVLLNGCAGIGTGFSTNTPCYNPKDIITNLKLLAQDKPLIELIPWYNGFTGKITSSGIGKFTTYGIIKQVNETHMRITELPIQSWTEKYKIFLDILVEKNNFGLVDIVSKCEDDTIDFLLKFETKEALDDLISRGKNDIYKLFNLTSNISTKNMHLFDHNCKIRRFDTAEDILKEFYQTRIKFNGKRKSYLVNNYQQKLIILSNKVRFLEEIINDVIVIYRKTNKQINEILLKGKYDLIDNKFSYLTDLPVGSFSKEKIEDLVNKKNSIEKDLKLIQSKTEVDILLDDLLKF